MEYLIGLLGWLWTRLTYRIKVVNRENLPERGPAIVTFNHTSLIDRAIILAALGRRVWFYGPTRNVWSNIFGDILRSRSSDLPEHLGTQAECDRIAAEVIAQGRIVAIMPERRATRLGFMLPFGPELGELLKRHPDVPVIPGTIYGTWRSIFSFYHRQFLKKWPRLARLKATILLGRPVSASIGTLGVREAMREAMSDVYEATRYDRLPLVRQFVYSSKRFSKRLCYADSNTEAMTQSQTLMRAVILSRLLKRKLDGNKNVGVFLPSSVGGAMANIAVGLLKRIPINLNYTIGQEVIDSCVRQGGITQVLTSKLFLQKVKLEPAGELVYLEDLRKELKLADKLWGLAARFLPGWFVDRFLLRLGDVSIDDTATIIFSSGTTGEPKGIVLSNHNVICNAETMVQHSATTEQDVVLGILPFFHSFGYTVTLWVPALIGVGSVFHFNPLEPEPIAELLRKYKATMFFATSTFLRTYIRKWKAEDAKSIRMCVTGAEKLNPNVARDFHEKFGVRVCEGYGCTELSPVVAVNVPDWTSRDGSIKQIGWKGGTIGHPLPGDATSIRHIDTFEPLARGEEGLLFVKGPNVMVGYLDKPHMTAEAIRDGWYNTGDIACLDDEGFIRITDRLARFSKIGGEMVPHARVEEELHEVIGVTELTFVVIGVPDARKGERLLVLHTPLETPVQEVWEKLRTRGLPPIWVPGVADFIVLESFPVLGTGKLDLRGIKKIAMELSVKRNTTEPKEFVG